MQDLTPVVRYFGARYYDPRTSVWQSADPILGRYLGGNPNYGVFEPANLGLFTYVRNNPIRLTDPNGESFGDFIVGIANGFSSSTTVGATPRMQGNADLRLGQMVGDVGAIYVGIGMMGGGGGMMGGGGAFAVATAPTGVGAVAGAAVAAGGAAVAGAGAAIAGKGAINLGTGLGVMLNEALNGGGGPNTKEENTKIPEAPEGKVTVQDKKFWKDKGIDPHEVKGNDSTRNLGTDKKDNVWSVDRHGSGNPQWEGTLDSLKQN